jgi:N-acetylmuramoyl-L-alanine amidase
LARDVQRALQVRFGLRDLGVHYQNLAVARPSWYPSALAEGLFVIVPEQEAAMRDEGFQLKYAEALLEGLEQYFRRLAMPERGRTP